jgi:hypothetical protein
VRWRWLAPGGAGIMMQKSMKRPLSYTGGMTLRVWMAAIGVVALAFGAAAGGIQWTPPSNWKAQPDRPMRAATYVVPAAAGDSEDGECAVFYFGQGQGGGVEDNIKRWIGQFEGGAAAKPAQTTINGLKVTTIEHAGVYLAGGGPMSQTKSRKPGYRILGAIVEAPQGNVFFKLTGPAKTVQAAKPSFDKMMQSVKR